MKSDAICVWKATACALLGTLLLGGSPVGKVLTIIFSVLGLLNIPIGTVVGVYSLWALLREIPPPMPSLASNPWSERQ